MKSKIKDTDIVCRYCGLPEFTHNSASIMCNITAKRSWNEGTNHCFTCTKKIYDKIIMEREIEMELIIMANEDAARKEKEQETLDKARREEAIQRIKNKHKN